MKFNIEESSKKLKSICGENYRGEIRFVAISRSIARSGMSQEITLFVKLDDSEKLHPLHTGRVNGCGLDRGHEAAYNTFCAAFGYNNPKMRYQEKMRFEWL